MITLQSKFRGCMLGALMGDCLGGPFEFQAVIDKNVLNSFMENLFTPDQDGPQIFSFTDDTAMTLSVAESLLHCKRFDASDLVKRLADRYSKEPFRGYGGGAVGLLQTLKKANFADPFEPARQLFCGQGSFGNGASMRVHPVPLFAYNMSDEEFIELVRNTALVTHAHPLGINGGILQALAVRNALKLNAPIDVGQFIDQLISQMESIEKSTPEVRYPSEITVSKTPYTDKLKEVKTALTGDLTVKEIAIKFGKSIQGHSTDETAFGTVPIVIYCALRAQTPINDYRTDNVLMRTLYLSISVGGDTDTIATMACAITGALHGDQCVIPAICNQCEAYQEITSLADKLFVVVSSK